MPPLNALSYTGVARAYVAQWRRRRNHGRRPSEPTTISRPLGRVQVVVRAALLALLLGGACVFDGLSRRQAGQKPTCSGRSRPRRGPARHPGEPQRAPGTGRVNPMVALTRQLPVALRRPGGAAPFCKSCVL